MSKLFFIGAGASAEAGYPITKWLTYPIADYLLQYRKNHNNETSRLEQYLGSIYHLNEQALAEAAEQWQLFLHPRRAMPEPLPELDFLPSIIEILSIIDLAIAEQWSFGPSRLLKRSKSKEYREFTGNELNRVRDRVLEALVVAFRQLENQRNSSRAISNLVGSLEVNDTIITTNWDQVLDHAIQENSGKAPNYGLPTPKFVDVRGQTLSSQSIGTMLLKLHGSFNWLYCSRCGDLYVNVDILIAPEKELRGRFPLDQECDCGAELSGLIVTPSFVKKYTNYNLLSIWRLSQKALETADDWIFIGYSLPDDDLWIRGMILRALTIRRAQDRSLSVTVVTERQDLARERRYRQLFADAELRFCDDGLRGYTTKPSARRGRGENCSRRR